MHFESKFPFTNKAKSAIDERVLLKPSIVLLKKAKDKLMYALKHGRYPLGGDEEVVVFYLVRFILTALNNEYIKNRVAIAISKSIYEEYIKPKERMDEELLMLCKELGIHYSNGKMPVEDYIRFSPQSVDYELYYQSVKDGYVKVGFEQFKRIMQEGITKKLIKIKKLSHIPEEIKNIAKEILQTLPKIEPKKVKIEISEFPPCIKKLLDELMKHKNLSHYARWALAVYLFNAGYSFDKILSLYSNLPDFNEKITRYQLNHIFKKRYAVPSCEKMKLWGLSAQGCEELESKGITNPIQVRKHAHKKKVR